MIFIFDILVGISLYDREYDQVMINLDIFCSFFLFNVARNLTKMFAATKINN